MYDYPSATHPTSTSATAGHDPMGSDEPPRSGDREGSASGSESAGYGHYMAGGREDVDASDDPHLALISQTLNADGTPKRPMNAFMIFARKRRPQISAANQMMRTGDISKILSKEWNSMDMQTDKKFYLDQAKKLKDNFNAKYPDYIYRRRPNNSRKKKKVEAEQQSPTESTGVPDADESVDETSPIEMDDGSCDHTGSSFQFRAGGGSSSAYPGGDGYMLAQNNSGYPPEFGSGQQYTQSSRLSGLPGQDASLSATTIAPLRIPTLADTGSGASPYSYAPPQSALSASGQGAQSLWDSSRSNRPDQVRTPGSTWPQLPAIDVNLARQRSSTMSTSSARSEAFSPNIPSRQWSNSAGSATSSSSGSTPFPTLTSPFYPAQSPSQRSADLAHSPTSHPTNSSEYFSSAFQRPASSAVRQGGAQEQNNYGSSPTVNQHATSPYNSQWPYPRPGSAAQHRVLPALQPVSSYQMQPPSSSSGSPPSAHSNNVSYRWDRGRYDTRQ
ncbi:hypothetical protein EIP86_009414 [Pleurotus ostreatoroseus]|nr:hypothetical protein EIP86_009414 [Pleurotus ostreatoroseus]